MIMIVIMITIVILLVIMIVIMIAIVIVIMSFDVRCVEYSREAVKDNSVLAAVN